MKLQFTLLFLLVYLVLASCRLDSSADKVISDTEFSVYRALIEEIYVIGSGKSHSSLAELNSWSLRAKPSSIMVSP